MRIGTLIPHFGEHCSRHRIVEGALLAEEQGFRSFWTRDHLVFQPHGSESQDRTFVDPFAALAAIAAVTTDCVLGTSVAIPVRWPLKLAQEYASLSLINDGGVVAGIGLGRHAAEFAAVGLDATKREAIFRDTAQILRKVWTEPRASFTGEVFSFEDIELLPKPVEPIPMLYGGKTPAAVRRAVEFADGWCPGMMPVNTLRKRLTYLGEQAGEERARSMYQMLQVQVSVSKDRREAEARVPLEEVLKASEGSRFYEPPDSGAFTTLADLEGMVSCGTPDEVADQLIRLALVPPYGVDDLVLDLRLQFDKYEEGLQLLGDEVIPRVLDAVPPR